MMPDETRYSICSFLRRSTPELLSRYSIQGLQKANPLDLATLAAQRGSRHPYLFGIVQRILRGSNPGPRIKAQTLIDSIPRVSLIKRNSTDEEPSFPYLRVFSNYLLIRLYLIYLKQKASALTIIITPGPLPHSPYYAPPVYLRPFPFNASHQPPVHAPEAPRKMPITHAQASVTVRVYTQYTCALLEAYLVGGGGQGIARKWISGQVQQMGKANQQSMRVSKKGFAVKIQQSVRCAQLLINRCSLTMEATSRREYVCPWCTMTIFLLNLLSMLVAISLWEPNSWSRLEQLFAEVTAEIEGMPFNQVLGCSPELAAGPLPPSAPWALILKIYHNEIAHFIIINNL